MTAYAFTNQLDPVTRDVLVDATGRRTPAPAPLLDRVLRVVATHRASFAPDASLGPDYAVADKATTGVAAAWRASVLEALKVFGAEIADVAVTVDVESGGPGKTALVYAVSFTDPRDPATVLSTGKLRR